MSVSPPPGGSMMPAIALGGGPGLMIRKVWPRSTDPNQTLRCVPVPVGPLTKTLPKGSIPMSGSPFVWIGSTTAGTSNLMGGGVCARSGNVPALSRSAQPMPRVGTQRKRAMMTSSIKKHWEAGHTSASQSIRTEFELPERNAPVEQAPAVGVAVAQRDAEQSWRHQGAVHRNDRERNRQADVGAQSRDSNGMRHSVIGHRSDLRRVEVGSRTGIAESVAVGLLVAIVVVEVEMGLATILAGHVAVAVFRPAASASTRARDKVVGANDIN